ncbi:MAG: hypothetical protein ACRDEB_00410 [Chitinophagaceae bacterium]
MLTTEQFLSMTNIVIDNFEGGYYHPDMAKKMKPADQALLAASGETMFGLDRKAGIQLAIYPEWKQFWDMVDKANARTTWKHYFMGGALNATLKDLAGRIMYQWFNRLSAKYLIGNSIDKIAADDRLVIHFSYASWNGEGWFKKFANALNDAKGTREQLFQTTLKARTESSSKAIRNAGAKMMKLFVTLNMK